MPRLSDTKRSDAMRALQKLGARIIREGGNHTLMARDGQTFAVPRHTVIVKRTMRKILREALISVSDFLDAL